jgi:hypothetical protein
MASYSAEDSFKVLVLVLEDYSIIRKLRAIIADNAPANGALYTLIQAH